MEKPPSLGLSLALSPAYPFKFNMDSEGVHIEVVLHRKLTFDEWAAFMDVLDTQVEPDTVSENSPERL